MNSAQRTVVVISSGVALVVLAVTLNLVMADGPGSGWFNYEPDRSATDYYWIVRSDSAVWRDAGVWFAGLALWTAAALFVFRRPSTRGAQK